ncbi:MAG: hypothetical protein LKG27_02425 [Clostridiaceae bacterium]|jgi:hypothetical protein|nr:hypothetical protein [Clostridiaceae bacterium]
MKFQYFRFFLSPINGTGNLFTQLEDSKINSINEVFKKDFDGTYRGMSYSIRYIEQYEDIVYLKVAKHTSVRRNKSPEENFELESIEHWPFINMIVSLAKDIDGSYGQLIAIEHKSSVIDNPTNLLRDWADSKNTELSNYGYVLSINPITNKESFWNVVKQYKNQIEEVTFEYSMPNLFNTGDKLEEELKAANSNLNAAKATVSFSNKAGVLILSEDNTLLKQSADYVDNGGGEFKIKKKGEKSCIVSAKKIKTKKFEIEDFNLEIKNSDDLIKVFKTILEQK